MPLVTKFGNWSLEKDTLCLAYGDPYYQIRLDEMRNPAEILDWIFQLEEKTWISSEDIGDLVSAIVYYFGRGVCGHGYNNTIDAREILEKRIQADA